MAASFEQLARLKPAERDRLLARLTPGERERVEEAALAIEDDRYAHRPWDWLTEQVITKDEVTNAERPFMDKPYVQDLVEALELYPMLAVPKTRRMYATWTVAAWVTHGARYGKFSATFWQSENEDKAAFAIDQRCNFIETHLADRRLERAVKRIRTSKGLIGRMSYQATSAYLWALPEGASVARTYTPSVWILDEIDYQPAAHQAFDAALPFTEKGGRLILISTSNGPSGPLAQLCKSVGFIKF